jgi:lipopolysaccharide/colanic/teichoic acid biosynthesis glycosyltransferase
MGLILQALFRPRFAKVFSRSRLEVEQPQVLSEQQFSAALQRERRRTERSRRPFVLMLVHTGVVAALPNWTALVEEFASELSHASRETDVIGWHENSGVLGAIFTELGTMPDSAALDSLRQRVRRLAEKTALSEVAADLELSFHFFPEVHPPGETPTGTLHRELYREQSTRALARGIKRGIDVVGSALALIFLSPLLLAISILIKVTSPGRVLFRQSRIGQHGNPFLCLKFRSMHTGSDTALHREYVSQFIAGKASMNKSAHGEEKAFKIMDDPRVTRLGRFLRRTSLDELPQLLNVLKGEMSLVGPRPPLPYELCGYDLWHLRRMIDAKPGITGLWQVSGRSRTTFDEMVRLDLRYAKKWSLGLDFMILLRTPGAMVSGEGAY